MKVIIDVPCSHIAAVISLAIYDAALCFPEDGDEEQRHVRKTLLAACEQIEDQIGEEAGGE